MLAAVDPLGVPGPLRCVLATVGEFERLVMASGAVLARTMGRRDWGAVVGRVPVVPDVRRSDLLDQVHAALSLPSAQRGVCRCMLTGMSGIGKTSLAASYVLDRADVYGAVFWVDGENPAAGRGP
jgi:polynucleotide 5'-kinase involved in rRNA processing